MRFQLFWWECSQSDELLNWSVCGLFRNVWLTECAKLLWLLFTYCISKPVQISCLRKLWIVFCAHFDKILPTQSCIKKGYVGVKKNILLPLCNCWQLISGHIFKGFYSQEVYDVMISVFSENVTQLFVLIISFNALKIYKYFQ